MAFIAVSTQFRAYRHFKALFECLKMEYVKNLVFGLTLGTCHAYVSGGQTEKISTSVENLLKNSPRYFGAMYQEAGPTNSK